MDLEKALRLEHSKKQCNAITEYIGSDASRFSQLMQIFFRGDYRLTQRAAWPMNYCVQNHPKLIHPYLDKLLAMANKPGVHDAVKRNTMRLLQDIEIPKKFHGKVMNTCFDNISSNEVPVAIKAFSLTVLGNMAKVYPEIRQELKTIIEDRWEHESAAFRVRAKKCLKFEV